jgi:RHS repeat-associated protein
MVIKMQRTYNTPAQLVKQSETLAEYIYLGDGTVIRIEYPEPSVWLDLWGDTSGTFNGLDQFNRVVDQDWQNSVPGSPTDIDRYQYGYDLDSNALWRGNVVGSGLDEIYVYDDLNRLTQMQRGTPDTSVNPPIIDYPVEERDWTLDATGNWDAFDVYESGGLVFGQSRTHNTVNEFSTMNQCTVPTYDSAGNTITYPTPYMGSGAWDVLYDAWNRLVKITSGATNEAAYQYDGANRQIVKLSYTSGTLSETRHYYFSNQWQVLEERVSGSMDKQYVWGVRYVDEMICRDDATPLRLYVTQDANFNVTGLVSIEGAILQRFVYEPYGNATVVDPSWAGTTDAYDWTYLHQGGCFDIVNVMYLFRFRYYHPSLGRWMQRDPVQYVNGANLYQYALSNPINNQDAFGLLCMMRQLPCWPHCHWIPTVPPWNVPPGPACDVYPAWLRLICNNAGGSPWGDCVRGCLLANWNVGAGWYTTNIALIHFECWNQCANAFGHTGPP